MSSLYTATQHCASSTSAVRFRALNGRLYSQLETLFGRVGVCNAGYETMWSAGVLLCEGERYLVNCPFCNDRRGRLSISYEFGVDGLGLDRGVCWNEGCLQNGDNLSQLRSMLLGASCGVSSFVSRHELRKGRPAAPWTGYPVELPGRCVPLTELISTHPAIQYVVERGFEPAELVARYDIQYCEQVDHDERHSLVAGRLVAPVKWNGVNIAWQAREPSSLARKMKYFNMSGPWRSRVLYGFDDARKHKRVVIVEGITDVWRIGEPAVATFGKGLSTVQRSLIAKHWYDGLVVVFADDVEAWRATERSYQQLLAEAPGMRLIWLCDPDGRDPADLSREEAWNLIDTAIRAFGKADVV